MEEKKLIIFTDSGDTFIDESTEIRDERGIVQSANMMKYARETFTALCDAGYRMVMVADGETESFQNVWKSHGLWDRFHTYTISEEVGIQKPSARMFEDAMQKNNLTEADKYRIVMIGNNIRKDVKGAKEFGLKTIWIHWNERYFSEPRDNSEVPDYTIKSLDELVPLIEKINSEL